MKALPLALLIACALGYAVPCYAFKPPSLSSRKEQEKSRSRWSIADFLNQKNTTRLWDLWLRFHSPSPFHFYFGAGYLMGRHSTIENYTATNVVVAAYASLLGIEGQAELGKGEPHYHALFNLRVLGYHTQSTNIVLQSGAKIIQHDNGHADWGLLAGVSMTLYLTRVVGIEGIGRHYFPSQGDAPLISGNRLETNLFLDFGMLRFYGGYYYDEEKADETTIRSGGAAGLRIYF